MGVQTKTEIVIGVIKFIALIGIFYFVMDGIANSCSIVDGRIIYNENTK